MGFGFGFDLMAGLFPIFFFLIFGIIIVVIIASLIKGAAQWSKNNASPVLTVEAQIVAKRADVSHHRHSDDHMSHSSTAYYVTFQVESGDRIELHVPDSEYGMLVEGDQDRLTFQGTRYQGFQRGRPQSDADDVTY